MLHTITIYTVALACRILVSRETRGIDIAAKASTFIEHFSEIPYWNLYSEWFSSLQNESAKLNPNKGLLTLLYKTFISITLHASLLKILLILIEFNIQVVN